MFSDVSNTFTILHHTLQNKHFQYRKYLESIVEWDKENSLEDTIFWNNVTRNRVTSVLLEVTFLLFVSSSLFLSFSPYLPLYQLLRFSTMSYNSPPVLGPSHRITRRGDVLRKGNGAETAQMTREFSAGRRDFLLVFMFSRHPPS